ncbi:MAG TPA: efflux RND transporter periplasmic adaptor subunit, partial [Chroococcales cyanobacterium]
MPCPSKSLCFLFSLFLILPGLSACGKKGEGNDRVEVKRGELAVTVAETGTIEALTRVEVKSKVAGQVARLLVDVGDPVKKGQLLIQLDTKDTERQLAQSKADREIAQARLARLLAGARPEEISEARAQLAQRVSVGEKTKAEYARSRAALEAGSITPREAETAKGDFAGSTAQIEESKAHLRLLRAGSRMEEIAEARAQLAKADVAFKAAEDQLSYSFIRSPMSGTVIKRGIEAGEMVSPGVSATAQGTRMLIVADLSHLVIQSNLNQVDVGKVRKNQGVEVRVDSAPGKVFHGKVWQVAPAAEASGDGQNSIQTFPIKTILDVVPGKEEKDLLKPGMSADIDIQVMTKKNAIFLPVEAI